MGSDREDSDKGIEVSGAGRLKAAILLGLTFAGALACGAMAELERRELAFVPIEATRGPAVFFDRTQSLDKDPLKPYRGDFEVRAEVSWRFEGQDFKRSARLARRRSLRATEAIVEELKAAPPAITVWVDPRSPERMRVTRPGYGKAFAWLAGAAYLFVLIGLAAPVLQTGSLVRDLDLGEVMTVSSPITRSHVLAFIGIAAFGLAAIIALGFVVSDTSEFAPSLTGSRLLKGLLVCGAVIAVALFLAARVTLPLWASALRRRRQA